MSRGRRAPVFPAILVAVLAGVAVAAVAPRTGRGKAIYLNGEREGGAPVEASVLGDVRIAGREAACVGCHQRSGLGTFEGTAATPSVAGRLLFAPRTSSWPRPAYTVATFAKALREGVDPAGRVLDKLMPRFDLSDEEAADLADYVGGLSAVPSPGVDERAFHLACVVTPDAPASVREATVAVVEAFAEVRSRRTRNQGRVGKRRSDNVFREWDVHVWNLSGPPEGWESQLDSLYERQQVFALLSGAGGADWSPVHRWCERRGVPGILPNVDLPPAEAGSGFYNLYFSRGLLLEAAAISQGIREAGGTRVAVVDAGGAGAVAGATLAGLLGGHGAEVTRSRLAETTPPSLASATDVVLWLTREEIRSARDLLRSAPPGVRTYLSSHLAGLDGTPELPEELRERALFARPFSLPDEWRARYRRAEGWLSTIPARGLDPRIADQTYAACQVLGEALSDVGPEYQRDYALEMLDHGGGLERIASFYPRLSFGPGARVLAKGCYLSPFAGGSPRWIVP